MRRFEFVGGSSNKFWEIGQSGTQVTVHFGRIGTNGQTQAKDLGTWEAAADRVRRLVREKLAEGYLEVGGQTPKVELGRGGQRPPELPPYVVPPLPTEGRVSIGPINLPSGRALSGSLEMGPRGVDVISSPPVIWATDAPVLDAGSVLRGLRQSAGALNLVPALLIGMDSQPERPWESREFSPTDPRRIDWFDAAEELAHAWRNCFEEEDEESLAPVEPFGIDFPGLASAPAVTPPSGFGRLFNRSVDPNDDSDVLSQLKSRRVALIAAKRPADTIAAIGWIGAVNVHDDPAPMSAVLRSWEDRWHARVVEIGFDTLMLTVGNPPPDGQSALALAAEHFAFCPDNIWQGSGTLAEYAKSLQRTKQWNFWWD